MQKARTFYTLVAFLLTLSVFMIYFPAVAVAALTTTLTSDKATVQEGETFTITAAIEGGPDNSLGGQISADFDPTLVEVQSAQGGALSSTATYDNGAGTLNWSHIAFPATTIEGPLTYGTATFLALQGGTVNFDSSGTAFRDDATGELTVTINSTSVTITTPIDLPPTITLDAPNPMTITIGEPYVEPGFSASDDVDGDYPDSAVTVTNNVNTAVAEQYTVVYSVTDSAGQETTVTRDVNVVDPPPEIVLIGADPIIIAPGDPFTDPSAEATDVPDGPLTVTRTGTVNTSVEDTYTLTYTATDSAGQETSITRDVIVTQNDPPVITLLEDNPITVAKGDNYIDPGATAEDAEDGVLTNDIITDNPVDTSTVGTYTVTYEVSDSEGQTVTETRTVYVRYRVTFQAGPGGSLDGTLTQLVEESGSTTDIIARPDPNKQVQNWVNQITGDELAGTNVTTYAATNVTSNLTILVNFEFAEVDFSATIYDQTNATNDPTIGNVAPDGPQIQNDRVRLVATASDPNAYQFAKWSGDVDTIADIYSDDTTIVMNEAKTVVAEFVQIGPPYQLTTSVTGGVGTETITIDPDQADYDGETVTLTANEASGSSHFLYWEGDVDTDPNTNPTTINMDQDQSVIAHFEPVSTTYPLTLEAVGGGTTIPAPGTVDPEPTAETWVDIETDYDPTLYEFIEWRGSEVEDRTAESTRVFMDKSKTVTAVFALRRWTLTVLATGNGTTDPVPNTYTYLAGEEATIKAIPNSGSNLERWTGDASGTALEITVLMNGDKTVTAVFSTPGQDPTTGYYLTVQPSPLLLFWGRMEPSGTNFHSKGSTVDISAIPNPGYRFVNWTGDVADPTLSSTTVTMDEDKLITANFAEGDSYILTLNVMPQGSGTTNPSGTLSFGENQTVEISATPEEGYRFVSWTGDVADSLAPTTTVVMDADKTVTANFAATDGVILTMATNMAEGGTTTPEVGTHEYALDQVVTVTATAALGYEFIGWTGDVENSDSVMTTVTMDSDKVITANFREAGTVTLTMMVTPDGAGSTSPPEGSHDYSINEEVSISANTGVFGGQFEFERWEGDVLDPTSSTTSVIMDEDKTVTAVFSTGGGPGPGPVPPNTPMLISPNDGAVGISLSPTLTTGAYSDNDNDPHDVTEWQISTTQSFSGVDLVLNARSSTDLTTLTVGPGILSAGTTYFWRARFIDGTDAASQWSEMWMFTTETATPGDQNGNGVPDDQEVDDPTFDVDNDGTPDSEQNDTDMLSLFIQSQICEGVIGVKGIENVEELLALLTIDEDSPYFPENLSALCDFIGFKVDTEEAGDTATITVYFSQDIPEEVLWYIFNTANGVFDVIQNATFNADGRSVTFTVEDGGPWDGDGVENGIILVLSSGYGVATGPCDAFATFTAKPRTGEKPLTVNLDATGSTGALSWDYGDGSTKGSAMRSVHTFPEPGTYVVTLTATGTGGCTSTADQPITVQAPPEPENDDNCFISAAGTGAMGYVFSMLAAAIAGLVVTCRRKR